MNTPGLYRKARYLSASDSPYAVDLSLLRSRPALVANLARRERGVAVTSNGKHVCHMWIPSEPLDE